MNTETSPSKAAMAAAEALCNRWLGHQAAAPYLAQAFDAFAASRSAELREQLLQTQELCIARGNELFEARQQLAEVTADLDLWKQSEAACEAQHAKLAERLAEARAALRLIGSAGNTDADFRILAKRIARAALAKLGEG